MSSLDRREYLDFELQIGEGRGRAYPVTVIRSPAGGTGATTMRFPFSQLELENRRKDLEIALLNSDVVRGAQRRVASTNELPIQQFGRPLFQALFTGAVRSCYEMSFAQAQKQGKGLRLKLRIGAPELAALPWEYLFDDARQNEYLSLSRTTPLVRYLEVPGPVDPLTVVPPLRILGVVASPVDLESLDVEREKQWVDEAVASLRARGLVDLTWLPRPTSRDLQRVMRSSAWHVLHFTGHGGFNKQTQEGYIALADEDGKSDPLSATQVSRLLGDQPNLRLVLLNACEGARGDKHDIFSSTAASLVRRGIPAVVAMQFPISDSAAIEFARTFYEVLMEGLPVDRAVSEARIAISLATPNTVEWGTPVLFMHSPDGILFDLPPRGPLASSSSDLTTTEGPEQARLSAPPPQATSNPIRSAPSPADVHQEHGTTRPIVPPITERGPGSPESAAPPAKPVGTIQNVVHVVSRPMYALTAGFIVIALTIALVLARGAGSSPPLATPTSASPIVQAASPATSGAASAAAATNSASVLTAVATSTAAPSATVAILTSTAVGTPVQTQAIQTVVALTAEPAQTLPTLQSSPVPSATPPPIRSPATPTWAPSPGSPRLTKDVPGGTWRVLDFYVPAGHEGVGPNGLLNSPTDLTLDRQGYIYVTLTICNCIQVFSPSGSFQRQIGKTGNGPVEFNNPEGLAIDPQGNAYVADAGNNRIQEISPIGKQLAQWGAFGDSPLSDPEGIALDRQGNRYIADSGNNRIVEISGSDTPVQQWRDAGYSSFNRPRGISLDSHGNLYVADTLNDRFQRVRPPSAPVLLGTFNHPQRIVFDGTDNAYVATNTNVQEFSPAGALIAQWGVFQGADSGAGEFNFISGLAIDGVGNLYVVDVNTQTLQELVRKPTTPG